jgi:glycerol kinase
MRTNWGIGHSWQPAMDDAARTKLFAGWKKAVTRTLDWVEE